MLYTRTLTVLPDTKEDKPAEEELLIRHPVISEITVNVTHGCRGLVHVAIFYGEMQLWPAKEGDWLTGEGITVRDQPYFEMPEEETRLRLLGVSPGTAYEHPIFFYLTGINREDVPPTRELIRVADMLEEFLEAMGLR